MRNIILLLAAASCYWANGQTGNLNSSFGNNGIVSFDFGSDENLRDNTTRKIIHSENGYFLLLDYQGKSVIAKLNINGTLDASFGEQGYSLPIDIVPKDVTIQPTGKIVIIGDEINYEKQRKSFVFVRLNSDGSLDQTFGNNGKVNTKFQYTSSNDNLVYDAQSEATSIQMLDEKIIIGGYVNAEGYSFALACYNIDGILDPTFGEDGKVITKFPFTVNSGSQTFSQTDAQINSIVIQNNKIVAGGYAKMIIDPGTQGNSFAFARYTENGHLDESFGSGGKLVTSFEYIKNNVNNSNAQIKSIIAYENKILATGPVSYLNGTALGLMQINENGEPDISFGDGGKVITPYEYLFNGNYLSYVQPFSVAAENNKIMVCGYSTINNSGSQSAFTVFKYNNDGSLDETFGSGGKVRTPVTYFRSNGSAYSLAYAYSGIMNSDKILVAGVSGKLDNSGNNLPRSYTLIKYNHDGSLDSQFGSNGILINYIKKGSSFYVDSKVQDDGKIISVGTSQRNYSISRLDYQLIITRHTTSGLLDQTFGNAGSVRTAINDNDYYGLRVSSSEIHNGKILVGGTISGIINGYLYNQFFIIFRYNINGTIDETFGENGKVIIPFFRNTPTGSISNAILNTMILQDDKIIAGGSAQLDDGSYVFAMARLNVNGDLDATFGEGGQVLTIFDNSRQANISSILYIQEKIIAVGSVSFTGIYGNHVSHFGIASYNLDGTLDEAFGVEGKTITPFPFTYTAYNIIYTSSLANPHVIIKVNDKLLVGGSSISGVLSVDDNGNPNLESAFTLVRYNLNGTIDESFGEGGKALVSFPNIGEDGKIQSDSYVRKIILRNEMILLIGNSFTYEGVAISTTLLNQNGIMQHSFGDQGKKTILVDGFSPQNFTIHDDLIYSPGSKLVYNSEAALASFLLENNDFQSIDCPGDKVINMEPGFCSTVVGDIDPQINPLNSSVVYKLEGATIAEGSGSASGLEFNNGITSVTYSLISNPDIKCVFSVTLNSSSIFYLDVDEDGFGDPNATTEACTAPTGYVADNTDCDDADNKVYPGAPEFCDGKDNDCDGTIDEGVKTTFYLDADNDGFGDPNVTTESCTAPTGYVVDNTDCDDTDNTVYPGAPEICDGKDNNCNVDIDEGVKTTFYLDADNDGFGDPNATTESCTAPTGYVVDNTDCDDTDNTVYPGAPELCDGKDNDCDGDIDEGAKTTYYQDADNDGYGNSTNAVLSCTAPTGYAIIGGDCDDNDPAINPGSIEICGNSIDENCDIQADEGCNNTLLISIEDITVYESMGVAELTVKLSRFSNLPVSVTYKTADGSARSKGNRNSPKDYTAQSGTITIPAGSLSASIQIDIDIDNVQEPTKVFYVDLSKPTNAGIGQKRATVTILDGSPETIAKIQTEIVHESINGFNVRALPNPSQNYFTIITRSNSNMPVSFKVIDILGRSVEQKQNINANSTILIGHLYRPGVYVVEVVQGSERQILRLVKIAD